RRDQTLDAIGPFGAATNPPNLTFITDPVAQLQYVLDNNAKTAQETALLSTPSGDWGASASGARAAFFARTGTALSGTVQTMGDLPPLPPMPPGGEKNVMIYRGTAGSPPSFSTSNLPTPTTEDLGKQTIEGVECTGTRTTV